MPLSRLLSFVIPVLRVCSGVFVCRYWAYRASLLRWKESHAVASVRFHQSPAPGATLELAWCELAVVVAPPAEQGGAPRAEPRMQSNLFSTQAGSQRGTLPAGMAADKSENIPARDQLLECSHTKDYPRRSWN